MAGPIELLIAAIAFGIVGFYLYIVHRFIRAGEQTSSRPVSAAEQKPAMTRRMSPTAAAHI